MLFQEKEEKDRDPALQEITTKEMQEEETMLCSGILIVGCQN